MRAFDAGFLKGAGDRAGWFGVRPSTQKAMEKSQDEDVPVRDRAEALRQFHVQRAQEAPMGRLKAMVTGAGVGAAAGAVPGALIGLDDAHMHNRFDNFAKDLFGASHTPNRKSLLRGALRGAVKGLGVGALAGGFMGGILPALQKGSIGESKRKAARPVDDHEKEILKSLREEIG